MAKRRGKGEGTITQLADGRWQGRVDLGRDAMGRRRRKAVYGTTREKAAKKLAALLGRAASGELLATSTPTVKTWLDDWHRTHAGDWRDSTARAYRFAIDSWLVPAFGATRLEALKPIAIQRWANQATANGPRRIVTTAHIVLRAALTWAMQQRVLTYNPAALVKVPGIVSTRPTPLSAEQAGRLLEAAAGHRLGAAVATALLLGLRVGEVCGLTWPDVDLPAKTLRVRQQAVAGRLGPLKTAASRRTLVLPDLLVELLTAQRTRQRAERLKAGGRWTETDRVFTRPAGQIAKPRHVREALAEMLTAAGLASIKFHGLRHTAATLLLNDGTPVFTVSRVLGHSQLGTTANVYGHLVDEMAVDAAVRMDRILGKRKGIG